MISDVLRKYIDKHSELIRLEGEKIDIGILPTDRLLFLDGKEESTFLYSFMEYAMLREKFRSNIRKKGFEGIEDE